MEGQAKQHLEKTSGHIHKMGLYKTTAPTPFNKSMS